MNQSTSVNIPTKWGLVELYLTEFCYFLSAAESTGMVINRVPYKIQVTLHRSGEIIRMRGAKLDKQYSDGMTAMANKVLINEIIPEIRDWIMANHTVIKELDQLNCINLMSAIGKEIIELEKKIDDMRIISFVWQRRRSHLESGSVSAPGERICLGISQPSECIMVYCESGARKVRFERAGQIEPGYNKASFVSRMNRDLGLTPDQVESIISQCDDAEASKLRMISGRK